MEPKSFPCQVSKMSMFPFFSLELGTIFNLPGWVPDDPGRDTGHVPPHLALRNDSVAGTPVSGGAGGGSGLRKIIRDGHSGATVPQHHHGKFLCTNISY